jgi:sorbitol/mannitol transport system permease protein
MSQPNVGRPAVPGPAVVAEVARPRAAASAARRDSWLRRLPLLPALIYVFLITQIPFALTVYYSFFSWNLLRPGSFQFAGLQNYAAILTDPSTRIAIVNTVVLTLCAVAISVVIGVLVALLLNREVFGKGVLRTLMIGSFLVMPTAAALIWKDTLLNPIFGLVDYVLSPVGLGHVDWVNRFPMATIVTIEVWRWTPFMMLIVLAGLQSQNLETLEAARVDGADAISTFRYITLPFIRPFVELGALLGSLFIVQTFDSIFMTTQGGPGEATTNIPFLLYLVAFQGFDVGKASAIGVFAVILTMIVASFALRTLFTIFHVEARR